MKKILFCMLSFGYGGAESRIIKLVNLLSKENQVTLLINKELYDKANSRNDICGILKTLENSNRLKVIPKTRFSFSKYISYLWVILFACVCVAKSKDVFFHGVLGGILLTPIAKLFRKKTIVEMTSPDNVDFCYRFRLILSKTTDKYLAVSKSVKERAKRNFPEKMSRKKLYQYPCPHYFSLYNGEVSKDSSVAIISFCSRLIKRKNGILFAKAIREVYKEKKDIIVHLMGDGEELDEIKNILEPLIYKNIAFVGRESNPQTILSNSHIFVSLIHPDNYPSQSVLEAMDCANFLILTNCGDSGEFIKRNNGVLVDSSINDVKEKIINALDDIALTIALGKKSREVIVEDFSPKKIKAYLTDIIYKE